MGVRPSGFDIDHRQLLGLVAHHYPLVAHSFLRPLLEMMSLAREACGGDMDKVLVILVVAIRTTEHPAFATYSQDQLLSGEVPVFPSLGTNARSVAESVGAPKETIRRKVAELADAGWIAREKRELRLTARAYQELSHVREALEHLAVANFEAVAGLVRNLPAGEPVSA